MQFSNAPFLEKINSTTCITLFANNKLLYSNNIRLFAQNRYVFNDFRSLNI